MIVVSEKEVKFGRSRAFLLPKRVSRPARGRKAESHVIYLLSKEIHDPTNSSTLSRDVVLSVQRKEALLCCHAGSKQVYCVGNVRGMGHMSSTVRHLAHGRYSTTGPRYGEYGEAPTSPDFRKLEILLPDTLTLDRKVAEEPEEGRADIKRGKGWREWRSWVICL